MAPQIESRTLPGTRIDPLYPDTDGKDMSETDFHSAAMIWLREALQDFFADRPDVYVASGMLLYYRQGDPSGRRDPDVLVAKGVVGNHFRRSFRVWEENVMPQVLFEISSQKTWREDVGPKRELYESLGVAEYFLFDAEGVCIEPHLQGFRLVDGAYAALTPDADGALESVELGLRLAIEGAMLRLTDVRTRAAVPTRSERAEQERDRADALAAEVERLRAILRGHNGHE